MTTRSAQRGEAISSRVVSHGAAHAQTPQVDAKGMARMGGRKRSSLRFAGRSVHQRQADTTGPSRTRVRACARACLARPANLGVASRLARSQALLRPHPRALSSQSAGGEIQIQAGEP